MSSFRIHPSKCRARYCRALPSLFIAIAVEQCNPGTISIFLTLTFFLTSESPVQYLSGPKSPYTWGCVQVARSPQAPTVWLVSPSFPAPKPKFVSRWNWGLVGKFCAVFQRLCSWVYSYNWSRVKHWHGADEITQAKWSEWNKAGGRERDEMVRDITLITVMQQTSLPGFPILL